MLAVLDLLWLTMKAERFCKPQLLIYIYYVFTDQSMFKPVMLALEYPLTRRLSNSEWQSIFKSSILICRPGYIMHQMIRDPTLQSKLCGALMKLLEMEDLFQSQECPCSMVCQRMKSMDFLKMSLMILRIRGEGNFTSLRREKVHGYYYTCPYTKFRQFRQFLF